MKRRGNLVQWQDQRLIQIYFNRRGDSLMNSSNNHSSSVLFKVGDHDFPASLSLITCHNLIHFVSLSIIFSGYLYLLCQSFQLSQDVLVSVSSSHGQKRLFGVYVFYLWLILLCRLVVTLFWLISLQFLEICRTHFSCL